MQGATGVLRGYKHDEVIGDHGIMQIRRSYGHAVLVFALVAWSPAAQASDCSVTSVGFTPLNDLGTGLYLDQFQGRLYPKGSNDVPAVHA